MTPTFSGASAEPAASFVPCAKAKEETNSRINRRTIPFFMILSLKKIA